MVKTCCVYGCTNRSNVQGKSLGIKFFRFPTDKMKKKAWVKAINRESWEPTRNSYVCSAHFVGGWHSIDVEDENFRPTVFSYKQRPPTVHQVARRERQQKRRDIMIANEERQMEKAYDEKAKKFSVACHSYASTISAISPPECDVAMMFDNCLDDTNIKTLKSTGSQCEDDPLIKENRELKREVSILKEELKRRTWSTKKIECDDSSTRFYTGLPSFAVFMWLFEYLAPKASQMSYWSGSTNFPTDRQRTASAALNLKDQLFAVLMRLRLGIFTQDIADRFQISASAFSKYFTTWIMLLHAELKPLNTFPSRELVNHTMPKCFLEKYPSVRVIIDCTEIFVQKSSSLLNQNVTFSNYKHHNTFKFLVGITPSGVISFVSEAWGGRASDRQITMESGLLDLLQPGDSVMADKGFTIDDLLKERQCFLNIPPFLGRQAQFTTEQVCKTQEIAELRIHVERSIGRVKNFHIFDGILPLSLAPIASQIFQVCCWLTNLDVPMVDD